MQLLKAHKWWNSKIAPLLAVAYFELWRAPQLPPVWIAARALGLFLVGSAAIAALGHVVTDAFDVTEDRATGRRNLWNERTATGRMAVTFALLVAAIVPWFFLPIGRVGVSLLAAEATLFGLYAIPPFRLKERGVAGIVADAAYAHVVPAVFALLVFSRLANSPTAPWAWALVIAWMLPAGMRHLLHHQANTIDDDRRGGARTFAATRGRPATLALIANRILPIEFLAFLAILVLVSGSTPVFMVAFVAYVARLFIKFRFMSRPRINILRRLSDEASVEIRGRRLLSHFCARWLPVVILAMLTFRSPSYAALLVAHGLMFTSVADQLVRRDAPWLMSRLQRLT